jgi:hypothetical protein
MPPIRSLFAKPTLVVFWAWIALCLVLSLVSILDGSLHEDMLRAVDYAVTEGSELVQSREATATSFIYISLGYFVVANTVAALLVHRSAAGRKWAFILLIPLALWWAYESASSPIMLGRKYHGTIEVSDWIVAMLGGVVWLFILGYTARARTKSAI